MDHAARCLWNLFCIKLGYFNLVQIQYKKVKTRTKCIRYNNVGIVERSHKVIDISIAGGKVLKKNSYYVL